MGCGNTKTASTSLRSTDPEFKAIVERVQSTWPAVKRIENLGPKTFAHLLHVYPILKRMSNVSQTLKYPYDFIRINKVREMGNMLLSIYADVIKHADTDMDERIRSKALILNRQGIQPRLIEHFGESLSHLATHQINIRLTHKEKQSWEQFTRHVSTELVAAMAAQNEDHSS